MAAPVARLLCVMGSGETAPTMVSVHQELMERAGSPPATAVLLDSPYGFEENAAGISTKAMNYFANNVGRPLTLHSLIDVEAAEPAQVERMLNGVRDAAYVFAGPGSPSYALRQWRATILPDLLRERVTTGGCVTFASAAATTLGRVTLPVYEIYKVGERPRWLDGLDVTAALRLDVAVIPHYDNAQGGTHDTRYCFMGARRLEMLEAQMPAGAAILGVAEHTAAILDADADTLTVKGRGFVAFRAAGHEERFPVGAVVPLERFRRRDATAPVNGAATAGAGVAAPPAHGVDGSPARARFEQALMEGDAGAALAELLALESRVAPGPAAGDDQARLRSDFRGMLTRFADAAAGGPGDPRATIAPFVDLALRLRRDAREAKRFADADAIRDELTRLGVEVRDTPDGTEWVLAGDGDGPATGGR